MGLLSQYLFRKSFVAVASLIALAICLLLLERLLRIFQIVSTSINPASDAASMIVNLLPYYLAMAIPMALLLGIIITVDRFSRTSELTAAFGAGVSLMQMTRPFLVLAVILSMVDIYVEGFMQPMGRYNYRNVIHNVKQQSFAATLREGTFTTIGNRTFFAGTDRPGKTMGPIFIYEKIENTDGQPGLRLTTAEEGRLIVRDGTEEPVLQLGAGESQQIFNHQLLEGELGFESSAVAGTSDLSNFRPRGEDERELTTLELFQNRNGAMFANTGESESFNQNSNNAALHLRLARAALLLALPFLAVPLGINYGRNPSSTGIFIGIVLTLTIQKALEFGATLGADGIVPPWAGVWPIVFLVSALSIYLFWKTAFKMGEPPITTFTQFMNNLLKKLQQSIRETRRELSEPY